MHDRDIRKKLKFTLLGFSALNAVAMLCCSPAYADETQAASAGGDGATQSAAVPQDILVTANRRSEAVNNIPSAVDVLSSQKLQNFAITTLSDVGKIDPSLALQTYGAAQQNLIIRGVASTVGQTTGIYLDETPLLGGYNSNVRGDGTPGLRLHDIERIEVLKGPQGTLFGAMSMAGTLRVITTKPNLEEFGATENLEVAGVRGGNAFLAGDAAVNLPIIKDRLGIRVVGWTEQGGGFIDWQSLNANHRNVNDTHMFGGRIIATLKVTDDFDITASVNHQKTRVDGTQGFLESAGAYNAPFATNEIYEDLYNTYNVTGTYKSAIGDFIGVFTRTDKHTVSPHDTTPTATGKGIHYPASYVGNIDYTATTGELRYVSHFSGPFQMVVGGYYQDDDNFADGNTILTGSDGNAPCYTDTECKAKGLVNPGSNLSGTLHNVVLYSNTVDIKTKQYGIYGQADLKLLPNLTLTAGMRYMSAKINDVSYAVQDISGACGWVQGCVTTPRQTFNGGGRQSQKTYNFAVLYKPTPDISLYARAASGFRLGGVNTSHFSALAYGDDSIPLLYNPDSLWNYEGGVKAYLLDRKIYLTASYYHIDWTNQQLQAQTATAFTYTLNAGKTRTDGVEVTAQIDPAKGFSLTGAVNYVNARLAMQLPDDIARTGNPGYKGDPIPFTPRWTGSLTARYEFDQGKELIPYLQGGLTYRDRTQSTFNSHDNFYTVLPSYVLVDLKAGVRAGRLDVSVYAENVTNKVAYMGVYNSLDGPKIYPASPARYGIRLGASF